MHKVLESGPYRQWRPRSRLEFRPIRGAAIGRLCGTSKKMLYSQFTEGFDLPDLKDAKALIDELDD
jgi:hypothetical protein